MRMRRRFAPVLLAFAIALGSVGGWYAKKGTYTINGKAYQFDKQGYCINP